MYILINWFTHISGEQVIQFTKGSTGRYGFFPIDD